MCEVRGFILNLISPICWHANLFRNYIKFIISDILVAIGDDVSGIVRNLNTICAQANLVKIDINPVLGHSGLLTTPLGSNKVKSES